MAEVGSKRRLSRERVARSLATRAGALKRRFLPSFRRGVEDPAVPLSLDMEHDSTTLLIAFGGMQGGLGFPPFEFFKATAGFNIKRMFVRDLRQTWYHQGIRDGGDNIAELAVTLQQLIDPHRIDRLVVTGTSAGGYGALVFGSLLGAHTIIAFAPQTVLELDILWAMGELGDHRWDPQVKRMVAKGCLDARWSDLRRALPEARQGHTRMELHYDPAMQFDREHSERLAGLDGVVMIPREGGGHNISKDMRETGELEPLLRAALVHGAPEETASGF
jgi:hypothetical protein